LFFMLDQHNISWNFWPWKKLATTNSPYSINKPENYNLVLDYLRGGNHPGFEQSQKIFNEYLKNMRTENCTYNKIVPRQLLREKGCFIPAISYDTQPGIGKSFSGTWTRENDISYRQDDKMRFIAKPGKEDDDEGRGDNPWNKYNLMLSAGEWADYTVRVKSGEKITTSALLSACAVGAIIQIGESKHEIHESAGLYKQELCEISGEYGDVTVRIKVIHGAVTLDTIYFD